MKKYSKPTADEIKKNLNSEQYKITQLCGTEPPFNNEFWDCKKRGLYVDVVSGEPLFSSVDKFDSGTGWPSFTKPIVKENVTLHPENDFYQRIEVRSLNADSHLGHVFDDGPEEAGGLRYCINSAALRFIPFEKLKEEGYEEYITLFENSMEKKK